MHASVKNRGAAPLHFELCILRFSILLLSFAFAAEALTFPDTATLKKEYQVRVRKDGRPVLLSRVRDGDSLSLAMEWQGGRQVSARLEQSDEYDSDAFGRLTEEYGGGAAWHEVDGGKPAFPGLMQQWYLKGYGKETGWLGSGLDRGRFFLVFRAEPPSRLVKVDSPLALLPSVVAYLDSSSEWLKAACKEIDWSNKPDRAPDRAPDRIPGAKPGKAEKGAMGRKAGKRPGIDPVCYRSGEDSRLWVRITGKSPLALQIRLEEGESPALREIRRVVQTVPDASQADYAKDLSQMLLSEGQMFLAKVSQRLPGLFSWPSWQLQGSKDGQVASERFLEIIRSNQDPEDFLPALRLDGKRIRLAINLYYRGNFHLDAEERP